MTKTTATSICTCLTVFGERPDGTIVAGTCNEQVGAKARFRPCLFNPSRSHRDRQKTVCRLLVGKKKTSNIIN